MIRQPPKSPLFPSTTLFRSRDGAAVLTTEAQSLDQAKDQQQDARQRADLRVARHEADQGRRQAHAARSEEHTSELQSQSNLVCRLLLEKKKTIVHTLSNVCT